jgi:hypothetical protein
MVGGGLYGLRLKTKENPETLHSDVELRRPQELNNMAEISVVFVWASG